jgi:hypothetical protein
VNANVIKLWAIASAAVLGLSVLLPWVTALGISVALIEGSDGQLLLAAAAAAVGVAVWRPESVGARVLAVFAGGLGLYEFVDIFSTIQDVRTETGLFAGLVSVAFGAYLACAAAVSLLAWAVVTQFKLVTVRA